MTEPVVVILAAGKGTRMRSRTPKLLHTICGRPMIAWPVAAARAAGASSIVVVDAPGEPLRASLDEDIVVVVQPEARGTADAARAAAAHLQTTAPVVLINADVPLITPETIAGLAQTHEQAEAGATILTARLDDPNGYGRIVRGPDGSVLRVVETKAAGDATMEQLQIKEINTGIYAFEGSALASALERVGNDNVQGEYYLPDVLEIILSDGHRLATDELTDSFQTLQINDRIQLAQVRTVAQRRINDAHMLAGATIINPEATVIDADVTLGQDVTIEPGTVLHGRTRVGDGSTIGPHTTLCDVTVGRDSKVIHSYATQVTIADRVAVGPFSYLRPGTVLQDGSKAGAFVEIKNSEVGERSKVPHLSYIGDTTIGEDANLGASTITGNYDGFKKHRTKIGARVHTSVDTTLIAPVTLGDDAYTGAGSVITDDLPDGALGIARPRQTTIEGYAAKRLRRHEAGRDDQKREPDHREAN